MAEMVGYIFFCWRTACKKHVKIPDSDTWCSFLYWVVRKVCANVEGKLKRRRLKF